MFKRLGAKLAVLAVVAFSAVGIGAIAVPNASAANCTGTGFWGSNPRNSAGNVGFKVQIGQCTDVDQVRIKYNACGTFTCTLGNYRYYDGFYDGTQVEFIWAYLHGTTGDITVHYPPQPGEPNPNGGIDIYRACWYTGTHGLGAHYWYQIHGATSHQWGVVHEYYPNVTYYVEC